MVHGNARGNDLRPVECGVRSWRHFVPGGSENWHELAYSLKGETEWESDDEPYVKLQKVCDTRIAQLGKERRPFISTSGFCGRIPKDAEDGNCLSILFGCDVPVVLWENGGSYTFIGECYIQGLMNGEVIKELEAGSRVSQDLKFGNTCSSQLLVSIT